MGASRTIVEVDKKNENVQIENENDEENDSQIIEMDDDDIDFAVLEKLYNEISKRAKRKIENEEILQPRIDSHEKYQRIIELRGRTATLIQEYNSLREKRQRDKDERRKLLWACKQIDEAFLNLDSKHLNNLMKDQENCKSIQDILNKYPLPRDKIRLSKAKEAHRKALENLKGGREW